MLRFLLVVTSLLYAFAAQAAPSSQEGALRSMAEMKKLVAEKTPSREYLWCAIMSANLNMMDVYGLFIRKAAESATDADALGMAIGYMMGFVDNELMHIKGSNDSKQAGEILAASYSTQCMKHIMPK